MLILLPLSFSFSTVQYFKSLLYVGYASSLHQLTYLESITVLTPLRWSASCPHCQCKMETLTLASSKVWKHFGNTHTTGNYWGHLVMCQHKGECLTASCRVRQKHTYLSSGQPQPAHLLAPVHPEPCPASRTKKKDELFLTWWARNEETWEYKSYTVPWPWDEEDQ